jgi:hypothetical protein
MVSFYFTTCLASAINQCLALALRPRLGIGKPTKFQKYKNAAQYISNASKYSL